MIEFNRNDYNLDEIEDLAKISKLKTYADYRVYGLKEDKNPPILIELNYELFQGEITDFHRENLKKFFLYNDINLRFSDDDNADKKLIWVGLRRDLRDDVQIATACVQTIILFLEGKLDLEVNFKVPGLPFLRGKKRKKH